MASSFKISFVNDSSNKAGSFCLFQTNSDQSGFGALFSLAWIVSAANTTVDWVDDLFFYWANSGVLAPGVTISLDPNTQGRGTDGRTDNQVTLTELDGTFAFTNPMAGPQAGTLYLQQDATIPVNTIAAGIGTSKSPTFMTQGAPNVTLPIPTTSQVWVIFGDFVQNEVLDLGAISGLPGNEKASPRAGFTQAAQVVFPSGVKSMVATLNPDNSWTIVPS